MEELLTCFLCSERYDLKLRRPKVLDCGHTFCLDCLQRHDQANGRFCPKERKVFKDPPLHVRDSYDLISCLDSLKAEEADNKNSEASRFWCTQCAVPASPECVAEHRICKINSVQGKKMQDAKCAVRKQVQCESSLAQGLINFLGSVRDAASSVLMARLQDDIASFADAKEQCDLFARQAETSPGSALMEGGEGATELQNLMSKSAERVSILEKRRSLLDLAENCTLSVPPGEETRPETLQLMLVSRYLAYRIQKESEQESASPGHSAQSSAPQLQGEVRARPGPATQWTWMTPTTIFLILISLVSTFIAIVITFNAKEHYDKAVLYDEWVQVRKRLRCYEVGG